MVVELINVLYDIKTRGEFREWLFNNVEKEMQCFAVIKMGRPIEGNLAYLDAVEEALCFGYIDSVTKKDKEGRLLQRFSKRRKNSNWTELNKERARRLIKLGKMTKYGEMVLPNLDEEFKIDDDILEFFKKDNLFLEEFIKLPNLYVRVRVDNIQKVKKDKDMFLKRLEKFMDMTRKGKLYGSWNDYGRLLEY